MDADDLDSSKQEIVSELENIRDECQDSLDNMPDQLQDGDTGMLLQERIDAVEQGISDIESIETEGMTVDDFISEVESVFPEV